MMNNLIGRQLGNYRIIQYIGNGTFGAVYLGEHIHLQSKAAIKIRDAQLQEVDKGQFLQEARIVASLDHPNIVRVFDYGVMGNTPFLMMNYAPNGSLRQRHLEGTQVPVVAVVSYVKHVADALQYAHDKKLIHRDVKPENMLVGGRNEVLLGDFGISIAAPRTGTQSKQDKSGTPRYMAPEMFRAMPSVASDQYSLGIVVYEWLCGSCPYEDGDFIQMGYQHTHVPLPPLRSKLPTISPAIEQVVQTALAKDPQQRFASVQVFAHALEQASLSSSHAASSTQDVSSSAPPFSPFVARAPTPSPGSQPPFTATAPDPFNSSMPMSVNTSFTASGPISSLPLLNGTLLQNSELNLDMLPSSAFINYILQEVGKRARQGG